ncbi:MAG: redoxin family protein [Planctomyces sp.]|nr:redoxin family protein [Planctomyces sp.]
MGCSVLLMLAGLFVSPAENAAEIPPLGTKVHELRFKDIRGLERSLPELGEAKAYVFVLTSTSCPLVKRSFPKLTELDQKFRSQSVQFISVNVGPDDTIREVAEQALEFNAGFHFVKDVGGSCVRGLGATRTPEVVVLDSQHQIVYRGRIDDQLRIGGTRPSPSRRDLEEALSELLAGKPVTVAETPVDGCLIADLTPHVPDASASVRYYSEVSELLDRKCNACHRTGTAAPFPLDSLASVRANSAMIREVVIDERMPPWFASAKHGTFQNDCSLSEREKQTLVQWIDAGMPEGEAPSESTEQTHTEQGAENSGGWRIGKPDLIVTMLEEHAVPETGFVPYRYSVLPWLFLEDTWVEAFEIRPDNAAVVHHCNMAYVTSQGAGEETFITGYVPGGQPMDLGRFDNGAAFLIPKGSGLGLQIHYTTTGKPERCRISVGLRFPRRTVKKQLAHFLLDPRRFRIPPGDPFYEVRSKHTLERDIDLLGMFTHMHVRGKDMTFFAEPPGKPRETLLSIPNYNFEWQLGYELKPGDKKLPKGTVIEAIAHFDNSPFNPFNPDATKTVGYGLQTVDEMFNGFVFFVHSDEDLSIEVDPSNGRQRNPASRQ